MELAERSEAFRCFAYSPGDLAVTVKCLNPGARVFVEKQLDEDWVMAGVIDYKGDLVVLKFNAFYLQKVK